MKRWLVAPGPSSKDLAKSFAERMDSELLDLDLRIFPDGESKIRIMGEVANKAIILVQSTYPPVDMHIMQLLLLAHRLSEEGGEVHALIPYLAYTRQDKEFLKGDVVSLGVLSHLLRSVGVKRMVTVDIHSVHGLGYFSFPAYSASAIPVIADYFKQHRLKKLIAAAPDPGCSNRVEAFANLLRIDHIVLKKSRDRVTGEVAYEKAPSNVEDRDVIMIDDIISSGGSIQRATEVLKNAGAGKILAACTHPILVGNALEKMEKAGVDICVGTNTVPSPISRIDITPILVSYFRSL